MSIQIDDDSRFSDTMPIIYDGRETFGVWRPQEFFDIDPDDETKVGKLVVKNDRAGRPDLISQDLYGTVRLYWVIIMFNKPKNPFGFPQTGTTIRYPFKDLVLANL